MREAFNDISRLRIASTLGGVRAELLYCGVLGGGKWWRNYLHVHSYIEGCYVSSGAGSFFIGGTQHPVSAGDLFIARPGQPHEIVSSRGDPLSIFFWAHTIEPAAGAASAASKSGSRDEEPIAQLVQSLTDPEAAPVVNLPTLEATLALMADEASSRRPGYVRVINDAFTRLIVESARAAAPQKVRAEVPEVRARSASESLVQTAIHYLEDNLARRFEVRDVAAQVNLSERQLSRIFHKATGTSILAYLTRLRMERAMQLLLHSELPIKQVAASVGYPDTHYFTTLFGRHTRSTPGAFRRSGGTQFLKRKRSGPTT